MKYFIKYIIGTIEIMIIAISPASRDLNHWKGEICGWIGQIESLAPHTGKQTSQKIFDQINIWKSLLD